MVAHLHIKLPSATQKSKVQMSTITEKRLVNGFKKTISP